MAGLLVSVRSVVEAESAVAGGATVIDVKEPNRGPLGRADPEVWSAVRAAVPATIPVSVALGELGEWGGGERPAPGHFAGIAFRKLGLAGAAPGWSASWARLRTAWGDGPRWVAVSYADWHRAGAPHPDEVLAAALEEGACCGILMDTWDKSRPSPIDASWTPWFARARAAGRFTVLAGGLDEADFAGLSTLRPELFAVRGSACVGGDRRAAIDPHRVALLVREARRHGASSFRPGDLDPAGLRLSGSRLGCIHSRAEAPPPTAPWQGGNRGGASPRPGATHP